MELFQLKKSDAIVPISPSTFSDDSDMSPTLNSPQDGVCFLKSSNSESVTIDVEKGNLHENTMGANTMKRHSKRGSGFLAGAGGYVKREHSLVINKLQSSDVADVRFSWSVFVKELFYHVFFPFSIPFCLYFDGWLPCLNHQFVSKVVNFRFSFQLVINCIPISLIVFYALYVPEGVSFIEVAFALFGFLIHKFMVASKYAFMDQTRLKEMYERELSAEELSEYELLQGWTVMNEKTIDRELKFSAERLGFNLDKVILHVDSSIEELRNFTNNQNFYERSSNLRKGYHTICLHCLFTLFFCNFIYVATLSRIVKGVSSGNHAMYFKFFTAIAPIVALGDALLPAFTRYVNGYSAFGADWISTLIIVASAATTSLYFWINMSMLNVGILDYVRRCQLLTALSVLIDPADIPIGLKQDFMYQNIPEHIPWVDLSVNDNIITWFVGRQIIQNFGLQFRKRISNYLSYTFLILLALVILLFVQFDGNNALVTNRITFYMAIYMLVGLMITTSVMIFYGSKANEGYWMHVGVLSRIQMSIREYSADVQSDWHDSNKSFITDRDKLKDSDALISSCLKLLEVDDQLNPVRVLGIRASLVLLSSMFTVILSLVSFAFRFYQSG